MRNIRWLLALICVALVSIGPTQSAPSAVAQVGDTVTFAVIGDYGMNTSGEGAVATLVKSWNPAFVITLGDNNYSNGAASTIDVNIGQYYHEFIYPYTGGYGAGAASNRFFPSLGNHDWVTTGAAPYLAYFTLPGNERYYTTTWGPVGLFAVDSDPSEPDGISSTSVQAQWLQASLAQSTACWKLVYFHHPPLSSGLHGSNLWMQWPFQAWGASAVLAGHDHTYERISRGDFPYFVNGLGGATRYPFGAPVSGSVVRYADNYGALRVTASRTAITYQFIAIDGTLIDSFSQTGGCPDTPTPTASPSPSATPTVTPTLSPSATLTPTPTRPPCCDFNGNGMVDIVDIQMVAAAWGSANPSYDFNASGVVDTEDVMVVASRWRTPP
ncbi:MAG: metallophosphoesterase [Anaerolineae bacterium]|nr:metallophosphoesterase [Anaerolineae bacterium]